MAATIAGARATDTTKTPVLPAASIGKKWLIKSGWATNASATFSPIKLYSGTTQIGEVIPVPATGGFIMPIPIDAGIEGGDGEAIYFQNTVSADYVAVTLTAVQVG